MEMIFSVKCPWCSKGEIRSDNKGDIRNSCICPKCNNAFVVDWNTLKAIRIKKSQFKKS